MRSCDRILQCLAAWLLLATAGADTLEETLAPKLYKDFVVKEARLEAIAEELETLPLPYLREPTGTGGALSFPLESAKSEFPFTFHWEEPVRIDAVALFPLRLYSQEVYDEYLFWPGSITIEAEVGGEPVIIGEYQLAEALVRQSLPELIEFAPVDTRKVIIRCSDLPQHPFKQWHAAGFAEIALFSGPENLAPRAKLKDNSRQGYHVLASEFLVDGQTPLGIPELVSRSEAYGFVKKHWGRQPLPEPYTLECSYSKPMQIDSVRLDPSIQHAYGQSFPLRFRIELLDAEGKVLVSDNTHQSAPLRTPGLNPYFAYFPETEAHALRLIVLEAVKPHPKALRAIALSEITSLHKGRHLPPAEKIEENFMGQKSLFVRGEPLDNAQKQMLAAVSDGLTQAGRVLPLRQWIEGLVRRRDLMDEQLKLHSAQNRTLYKVSQILIYGSLSLIFLVVGSATFFIVRNRIRNRREILGVRNQIASDLHDNVGSSLGAIILQIEQLKKKISTPQEQGRLATIHRLARESSFGLREVLNAAAPEFGRTQDIVAHMQELTGLLIGKTSYSFKADPEIRGMLLEPSIRKDLLLFYKEALYNAKRHSDCSHIDITLQLEARRMKLSIKDDGKGMETTTLNHPRNLRTLKQRAEWLSAELDIQSSLDFGTEIILIIPLPANQ